MTNTTEQLDTIINEHRVKLEKINETEKAANDIEIIIWMNSAVSRLDVDELHDSKTLLQLETDVKDIISWATTHFSQEEHVLPKVGKESGDLEIQQSIKLLLFQHTEIKARFSQTLDQIQELKSGNFAPHRWNYLAEAMRLNLVHTLAILKLHAKYEDQLSRKIRKMLVAE